MMAGYDVGAEIQGVVSSLQRNNPDLSATARVKRAWNASVDNSVAQHVTAVFVVPNTQASEVIIYVDNSLWATELTMQSELMRLNLNLELNKGINPDPRAERKAEQVEKLSFKVSKEQYISRKSRLTTLQQLEEEDENIKNSTPVELTNEELAQIQEAVAHIDDDRLRETAYESAKANLEWQKGLGTSI